MGTVYQRGRIWWIKYYRNGTPYRESTQSAKESDAKRLLRLREGQPRESSPASERRRYSLMSLLKT